jgi:hypothetical protein
MKSIYLLSILAATAINVQGAEMGPSDEIPLVDGTMFSFKSGKSHHQAVIVNVTAANQPGSNGEGVVVGPKGFNAWAPFASNNTCVPKGAEGLRSVIASPPSLDVREDRTYCVLGFMSDNCIGVTATAKEYQAPVVRLWGEQHTFVCRISLQLTSCRRRFSPKMELQL